MVSEAYIEVYKALRESQHKYVYFILAAAGAAIGLAVNQTHGQHLNWSQVPLGIGVIAWGLSFYCGCKHIAYINSTLYANANLLQVESGQHPEVGSHPEMMSVASEGIKSAIESNSDKANSLVQWQFRYLIIGAILYLTWHVLEMLLLS